MAYGAASSVEHKGNAAGERGGGWLLFRSVIEAEEKVEEGGAFQPIRRLSRAYV